MMRANKLNRTKLLSTWSKELWSFTWTLLVRLLLQFLKIICGKEQRSQTSCYSSFSDSSFSCGSPNKCFSELLELSSSVWSSNRTRNNIDYSQCTTTRLRPDTMKKTSRSWTCSEVRETLRLSSSLSTKNSNPLRKLNGSESPTLSRSSRLINRTRRSNKTSRAMKREIRSLNFKSELAKTLMNLLSWSDIWPWKTKSWREESLSSLETWVMNRNEFPKFRLFQNLRCRQNWEITEVRWAFWLIRIHSKRQTAVSQTEIGTIQLVVQDTEN